MTRKTVRELAKGAFMTATRGLSDEAVGMLDHLRGLHRLPVLNSPQRFNDKILHHKMYERDPRLPVLVDKLRVKDHVARVLGPEWVTPTLWSGARLDDAALSAVAKPSVLKANHASGFVILLDEETNLKSAARRANKWLRYDYHMLHREWAYGEVERRLLIEPRIDAAGDLPDYKFWVFNGKARLIQVDRARFVRHTRQFYDPSWKRLDLAMNYPTGAESAPAPKRLEEMVHGAETLARGLSFVRVDLYDCALGPRFGEMTFWPEAGLCRFKPAIYDELLGELWRYPRETEPSRRPAARPAVSVPSSASVQ